MEDIMQNEPTREQELAIKRLKRAFEACKNANIKVSCSMHSDSVVLYDMDLWKEFAMSDSEGFSDDELLANISVN